MRRTIAAIAMAMVLALAVSGCTRLTYKKDGVEVTYEYLFQDKGLEVDIPPEDTSGTIRIRFFTNSDPAIELAREALKAAQAAAASKAATP